MCNHPLLVLGADHPSRRECDALAKADGGLGALACAPKLLALQQILLECGIGGGGEATLAADEPGGGDAAASGAVATHRLSSQSARCSTALRRTCCGATCRR